ncbi:DUF485 domain-containing protein [Helicobacter marmotae]|uniref:DUF485 domain-containing protein n=1 Tax=Helicobacter marmotae TaxID=152490 RepID=A0A3D8I325_9HELI|nr:DUF485 domain-containing protein [Helicobacter marmotae]RDU59386.1 DUF485 domain-containing protein [Helicobacter marmotae]
MVCKKAYCEPINEEQRMVFKEFEDFYRFKMRFCLVLTIIILGCYFSFLILTGFTPDFLALQIGDSPVTLGIVFGLCSILLGVLGTYVYSFVVNVFLDKKEEEIIKKMRQTQLIKEEGNENIT